MKKVFVLNKFLLSFFILNLSFGNHTFIYKAEGITCEHCKKSINDSVKKIRTLLDTKYNFKEDTIEFSFKENLPFSKSEIKKIDSESGYPLKLLKISPKKPKDKLKLKYKQK